MSDTPGKQLMDFITEELLICDGEWLYDAEAKINEFLQEQKDVREHANWTKQSQAKLNITQPPLKATNTT